MLATFDSVVDTKSHKTISTLFDDIHLNSSTSNMQTLARELTTIHPLTPLFAVFIANECKQPRRQRPDVCGAVVPGAESSKIDDTVFSLSLSLRHWP